jgi:hypothetical protein
MDLDVAVVTIKNESGGRTFAGGPTWALQSPSGGAGREPSGVDARRRGRLLMPYGAVGEGPSGELRRRSSRGRGDRGVPAHLADRLAVSKAGGKKGS